MRIIRVKDDEVIHCKGCKGDNWVLLQSNANHYNKYFCNNCGNSRTMYTLPSEYKHG